MSEPGYETRDEAEVVAHRTVMALAEIGHKAHGYVYQFSSGRWNVTVGPSPEVPREAIHKAFLVASGVEPALVPTDRGEQVTR